MKEHNLLEVFLRGTAGQGLCLEALLVHVQGRSVARFRWLAYPLSPFATEALWFLEQGATYIHTISRYFAG